MKVATVIATMALAIAAAGGMVVLRWGEPSDRHVKSASAQRLISLSGAAEAPSIGLADAPVTVTVFSDFECPFCARFGSMMRQEVLPAERQRVRLVYHHFPIAKHAWARAAAEISICAYQQSEEAFWRFHDFFFSHQRELSAETLRQDALAEASNIPNLDVAKLGSCLAEPETRAILDRDMELANGLGVRSTPSVFVNGIRLRISDAGTMLDLVRQVAQNPGASISPSAPAPKRTSTREMPGLGEGNVPALGASGARVTVAVFSDFQCTYCAKFADMMRTVIMPKQGKNVRLVFHYLPLSAHPWSAGAAQAAACAYQQQPDYFWSFHDFFFQHQGDLTASSLPSWTSKFARGVLGLDVAKFQQCLDGAGAQAIIYRDVALANANGIYATPTVFVNGKETQIVDPEQLLTIIEENVRDSGQGSEIGAH
jgi:protein-disulfide isomerase